ncbi:MAG: sarcosine oxidase subunit gamma family protein [Pseudomonadota bacterium]|nr:sarcosine oxidase subunit gamma family protein [Pseudomonadota bacterium]
MTECLERRHGLESRVDAWPEGKLVALTIRDDLGHLNLRGNPEDTEFLEAAEQALGLALPVEPNTMAEGDITIFWLGPDEWLILLPADAVSEIAAALESALQRMHFALNDVSGGQISIALKGSRVRELLAKGCTLDLHAKVFSRGLCAQSGLAKASVLIGLTGDDDEFILVVRRSFSDYLIKWLTNAV